MKREVLLPVFPLRIISLVPSQTELLYELGLGDSVVGITKFCIHPEKWFKTKPRVGGTKNVDFEKIAQLQPDLIIGNKEENDQKDIEELEKLYPVWMSDISTFDEAIEMLWEVAKITNKEEKGQELIDQILKARDLNMNGKLNLRSTDGAEQKKVLYFIWRNPWMVVGKNTFIDAMLEEAGVENLIHENRYVELTNEEIIEMNPEVVFLSSEPFPFKEEHVRELQALLPNAEIKIVDGEMFSWYGARMKNAFGYFEKLIGTIR